MRWEVAVAVALYTARPGQTAYGYPIGIICARWHIPVHSRDVNHAASFDYPVLVPAGGRARRRHPPWCRAARAVQPRTSGRRQLEAEGVRAITSNCGFFGSGSARGGRRVGSGVLGVPLGPRGTTEGCRRRARPRQVPDRVVEARRVVDIPGNERDVPPRTDDSDRIAVRRLPRPEPYRAHRHRHLPPHSAVHAA